MAQPWCGSHQACAPMFRVTICLLSRAYPETGPRQISSPSASTFYRASSSLHPGERLFLAEISSSAQSLDDSIREFLDIRDRRIQPDIRGKRRLVWGVDAGKVENLASTRLG